VTFSGKWRGLFSASWHGQVVLGMARSVGRSQTNATECRG